MHKTGWAALAAGVMLLAGGASAQNPPPPAVVTNPSWASRPDAEALGEAYPNFAANAAIDGNVTLRCTARIDGGLDLCEVVRVAPAGLGFDRAGLSLSRLFRINPREVDGRDTKTRVQFTIRFRAAPSESGPPWTGPEPDSAHVANVRLMLATIAPAIEREFAADLAEPEVDADRLEKVRAIMIQVRGEFEEREKDAAALAMARLVNPADFERFRSGGGSPPEPSEDDFIRAADRADALQNAATERRRSLYCAQFDCPTLSPPPATAP